MSDNKIQSVKISCEECSKELATKQSLARHMKTHHKNTDSLPPLPAPTADENGSGSEVNDEVDDLLSKETEIVNDVAEEYDLIDAISQMC